MKSVTVNSNTTSGDINIIKGEARFLGHDKYVIMAGKGQVCQLAPSARPEDNVAQSKRVLVLHLVFHHSCVPKLPLHSQQSPLNLQRGLSTKTVVNRSSIALKDTQS